MYWHMRGNVLAHERYCTGDVSWTQLLSLIKRKLYKQSVQVKMESGSLLAIGHRACNSIGNVS